MRRAPKLRVQRVVLMVPQISKLQLYNKGDLVPEPIYRCKRTTSLCPMGKARASPPHISSSASPSVAKQPMTLLALRTARHEQGAGMLSSHTDNC